MADTTPRPPSLAAYHRTLSSHITTLLNSTTPSKHTANLSSITGASSSISPTGLKGSQQNISPPPLADGSSRTTETTTLRTPPELSQTREAESREVEQVSAWKEAGSKIFCRLPNEFNLVLDNGKSAKVPSGETKNGVKGLGIDLAISQSQAMAIKMGLMPDTPLQQSQKSSSLGVMPRHRPKEHTAPIEVRRLAMKASCDSLSLNSHETTAFSPRAGSASSLVASNRYDAESGAKSRGSTVGARRSGRSAQGDALRDPMAEDKLEDYEARRELRFKRKQAELCARIAKWRDGVQLVNIEVPEIEPTPPTPSIASSMLRFAPLSIRPTALPSSGASSPAPCDMANRLRALDALLGDMSLKHPRSGVSLPSKLSVLPPLHLIPDDPPCKLEAAEEVSTPKANLLAGILTFA